MTATLQVRERIADAVSIDFRVADTGIGIAPDRLPHIFDDFTQASYDIGLKYGGTGLGLAISKKLVELHGSHIAVESELGRGTTFSFALRLRTPEVAAEAIVDGGETAEPGALKGLKVLIADDNEVNVLVLTGLPAQVGRRDRRRDQRPARRRADPGGGLRPGADGSAHAGAGRLRRHASRSAPCPIRVTRGCRSSRSRPPPGWAISTISTPRASPSSSASRSAPISCSRRSPGTCAGLEVGIKDDKDVKDSKDEKDTWDRGLFPVLAVLAVLYVLVSFFCP